MGEKIYVNNEQAALVLGSNGFVMLCIPKFIDADHEIVPDYVAFLSAISILIKTEDKKFQMYMAKRWNEIISNNKVEKELKIDEPDTSIEAPLNIPWRET